MKEIAKRLEKDAKPAICCRSAFILKSKCPSYPLDTGHELNVRKVFRRRPGRLLNVLCTFFMSCVQGGKSLNKKHDKENLSFFFFIMAYKQKFANEKVQSNLLAGVY